MCPPSISNCDITCDLRPPTLKNSRNFICTQNTRNISTISFLVTCFLCIFKMMFIFHHPRWEEALSIRCSPGEVVTASWALAAERRCGHRFISYLRLCREAKKTHTGEREGWKMTGRVICFFVKAHYVMNIYESFLYSHWFQSKFHCYCFCSWKGGIIKVALPFWNATLF